MNIIIKIINHAPPKCASEPVLANRETDHADVVELTADEWSRRQDDLKVRAA